MIPESRSYQVQQISDLPGFYELLVKTGNTGSITKDKALRLSAVYSCVNAIACDLAGLTVHVYQKTSSGTIKLKDHPVSDLVKLNPNPEMRAFDWYKIRRFHTLLAGNSCTLIERSRMSPVKHLWALDPDEVILERVRTNNGTRGKLRYQVSDGISRPRYYNPEDIMHLKAYTWDGLWGQSVITHYAKQQIGIGIELDEFENTFLKKGMHPGGIFKHPSVFKDPNRTSFLEAIKKKFSGSKNAGTPMVLEQGMDYVPYDVKMVDQQFMELLKLNKVDICGIFGVPQSRIGISDSNTNFNNTEQEKRRYYESGLLPWAIPDEQEMTYKLLSEQERKAGIYIKYNFDGFLRGDSKTRAEVSRIWSQMGVPVNDLLTIDDRNPVDGGDIGLVQLNMAPIKQIGDIQLAKATTGKVIDPVSTKKAKRTVLDPIFLDVMARIVSRENIALTKLIKKDISPDQKDFDNFYADFRGFIISKLQPVIECHQKISGAMIDVNTFADQYIDRSKRSVPGQLTTDLLTSWRQTKVRSEIDCLLIEENNDEE